MANLAAAHRLNGDEATAAKYLIDVVDIFQEHIPGADLFVFNKQFSE